MASRRAHFKYPSQRHRQVVTLRRPVIARSVRRLINLCERLDRQRPRLVKKEYSHPTLNQPFMDRLRRRGIVRMVYLRALEKYDRPLVTENSRSAVQDFQLRPLDVDLYECDWHILGN